MVLTDVGASASPNRPEPEPAIGPQKAPLLQKLPEGCLHERCQGRRSFLGVSKLVNRLSKVVWKSDCSSLHADIIPQLGEAGEIGDQGEY